MDATRTIQVFLASSDELKNDRNTFGNLIRRLDNIYEKRGIRIKLVEWEDFSIKKQVGSLLKNLM